MQNTPVKLLILGASGMLGNTLLRFFSVEKSFQVFGAMRSADVLHLLPGNLQSRVITGVNVESSESLDKLFADIRPNIVVNCIGVIKQSAASEDPLCAIPINALLPHRIAHSCALTGARLIHMSTDCVFSGTRGMYTEADLPDATDLYGRSKLLGELSCPNTITLRTSIIGHELRGNASLVNWFLSQNDSVRGFTKAIFSGLPAVEIARVIRDYVSPRQDLFGLYHLSANPINKFNLLEIIAYMYGKDIEIIADDKLAIDRSLDSTRFKLATGYVSKNWTDLVRDMHAFG